MKTGSPEIVDLFKLKKKKKKKRYLSNYCYKYAKQELIPN